MTKNKVMFIVIVLSVMAVLLSIGLAVVFVAMDTKLGSSISIQYLPGNYIRYDVTNIANASEFVGSSAGAEAFTTTTAIPQYKGENANSTTGYMFAGWYTDEELTNEYIEGSTLDTGITLYPKFVEGTVDVSNMTKTADGYVINDVTSSNVVASVVGARQEVLNKQSTIKAPATISGLIIPDYIKEGNEYIPVVGINAQWTSSTSGAKLYIGNNIKSMPNNFALNNTNLTEAYIGSGITEVTWHSMFESCTNLAKVEFSYHSKLAYIGLDMFRSCHGLKTIRLKGTDASAVNTIPSTVTVIGAGGFAGCRNAAMTALQLPDGITAFGNQAFYNCQYLASLNMPSSLETIGSETFSNCRYLSNVVIPNTVTTIGQKSFTTCVRLKTVKLPSEVETLDTSMFEGCTALTTVTFDANSKLSVVKDRVFFGCTKLTTLVNGTTTDYTLPASVTTIGDSTFSGCTALTTFVMPTKVTTIANNLFEGCTVFTGSGESSARSLNISNITSIGTAAFKDCDALKTVTLSSSLTAMGTSAFESCEKLLNINLKDVSLTSIPERAFYDCNALRTARFPYSVKTIGKEAFAECNWLTYLWYYPSADGLRNSGITTIEEGAFYNSPTINRFDSINNQYISGTTNIVEFFSEAGFTYNYYHINIPTSVTTIGANAFNKVGAGYYNSASQRILIDGEIDLKNADGKSTIYGSHGIEMSVRIPNTNITIAANAFGNNPRIKYVSFGDRLINGYDIGSGDQKVTISTYLDVFSTCQYLDTLVFSDAYTEKTSATTSTTYPGVTIIPSHKFSWNETIRKIVFPESLETIAAEAFNRCSNLTDISSLGSCYNLVEILDRTFYHCYGIVDLYLPYSLEILNTSAFSHCTNLEHVYLFNDNDSSNDEVALNKLGSYAFYNCAKLKSMTLVNEACSSIAKQSDWSDTTVQHVETCDCNNFAVVKRDSGTTNLINTSNRFNVSDSVFESADEITAAIASFKKKYELYLNFGSLIADGCVELVPDRDGYDDYESAFKFAQEFINQSYNPVVKNMDLFKENSATILVNKGLSVTLSLQEPDSSMKYDEYDTLLAMAAKLFGCASVSEFTSTATTLSNYYKNKSLASDATVLDRLKYDGAIHTANGSFLFPYLVESNFSEAFCMLLIIDPSGLVFVVVSDAYEAFKAVNYQYMMHDTEASDIRLTGLCGTMVKEDDIVYIPDSVTILGGQAFYCNTALTQVRLSNNINALYGTPFYGCSSLTNTIVGTGIWDNENLADGAPLPTYDWNYAFKDTLSDNITVTIEEGVTTIPEQAMYTQSMYKLVLPSTLGSNIQEGEQAIGKAAFLGCGNLETIDFSRAVNLTQIYTQAFSKCYSLSELILPSNIEILSESSFSNCTSLETITFTGNALDAIGKTAFYNCPSLTNIYHYENGSKVEGFPTGLTTISKQAFAYCSSLLKVLLPSTITAIGELAFSYCPSITTMSVAVDPNMSSSDVVYMSGANGTEYNCIIHVGNKAIAYACKNTTFPSSTYVLRVGSYAYTGNTSITSITIPAHITRIAKFAFQDCTNLKNVKIAESNSNLQIIENGAFSNCSSLETINLYSCTKLRQIGTVDNGLDYTSGAFSNCSKLYQIGTTQYPNSLPNSVTTLGDYTFYKCVSLGQVNLSTKLTAIGKSAFYQCSGLTSISIPSSVLTIGNRAFYQCTGLQTATISEGVETVEASAFYGCKNLETLVIPNSITTIGSSAFGGLASLKTVTINQNVLNYNSDSSSNLSKGFAGVFGSTSGAKTVTIAGGATTIKAHAFYNCANIITVNLPNTVESIDSHAFNGCTGLTTINLPNSLKTISNFAFSGCTSLTSISLPASVTSIDGRAYNGCINIETITVASGNTIYNDGGGNNILVKVDENSIVLTCKNSAIPGNVNKIGAYAYYNRDDLTSFVIPANITNIGSYAFYSCSELTSLTISEGVQAIGYQAFFNCSKLTSITIPSSITSVDQAAFGNCTGLTEIVVADGNTKYSDMDCNIIYELSSDKLIAACNNSSIPNTTKWLDNYSFAGLDGITTLVLPDSLEDIGGYVFQYCENLASITIPSNVTYLRWGVFRGCSSLTTVTIKEGSQIEHIGPHAFDGCKSLNNINLDVCTLLVDIQDYAFYNCDNLTTITIPASVTTIGQDAFSFCDKIQTITFAAGSQLTTIEDSAFSSCVALTKITIPASVTSIGKNAFVGCSKLTNVTFENTTGWYYTSTSTATSGTSITVTNTSTNATNLRNNGSSSNWGQYYLKRK
ncbi:MAG: leucine-rich repeat protein [Clostridia bacterium]|nr:leucine-rich repeat protein [Clostridia bacterium]